MIGHARLLDTLAKLVARSPADTTSISAHAKTYRVSRFAYEAIHQDLVQESVTVYVRVTARQRIGVAATDTVERASLQRCLRAALAIAHHAPPTKGLPALPPRYERITTTGHCPETINTPPKQLIDELTRAFRLCSGVGAQLAGSFAVGEDEVSVVNSAGVACYTASTFASTKLVAMYRKLSGFASGVHRRLDALNLDGLLEQALKQCLHRHEPITVPTGTYEVILEPEAVADLVTWLGYIAFGAKSFQERTSCLAGRMGEPLMDRRITILDDGNDPMGLAVPFDFEGIPKQRVLLIDRGKAAGIVYDTTYGHLYGHPSTGHGFPPDEIEGPLPSHLFMEAGAQKRDELIRSCKRGLLIPRFHYVNGLLNPREALMTGLTREGACLIKDGKLSAPISTMRFTQGLLEAFRHVLGISRARRLIADPTQELGCAVMPTLHLAKFRFTGRSED